jgi:hypothetical protein
MSSASLFLTQPRRDRYVLRLYKCIGLNDWLRRTGNFVTYGASCVTGIGLHTTLAPALLQESPSSLTALEGQGRPYWLVIPSIADAIISLCSVEGWQS